MANEILNFIGWEHRTNYEGRWGGGGTLPSVTTSGSHHSGTCHLEIDGTSSVTGNLAIGAHGDDSQGSNPDPAASSAANDLPSAYTVGFAFKYTTGSPSGTAIGFFSGLAGATTTDGLGLRLVEVSGNQRLRVVNSLGATLVTLSKNLSSDTWYYIELSFIQGNFAPYTIRIDEGSTDGVDYKTGSSDFFAASFSIGIGIGIFLANASGPHLHFDDLYIRDGEDGTNLMLGECSVGVLRANADGTDTAWTNDYTYVDDVPTATTEPGGHDSGSTVISSSTNNQRETPDFQDSSTITDLGTIHSVKASLYAERDTSPSASIDLFVRDSSSTRTSATAVPVRDTYDSVDAQLGMTMTAPPSGGSWDTTELDAIEAGPTHRQAQSRQVNCTAVWVTVLYAPSAAEERREPVVVSQAVPRAAGW